MNLNLKRFVAGAVVAASVAGVAATTAQAAPPLGGAVLGATTGNQSTIFTLSAPSGAVCTGSGTSGYRFHTFITNAPDSAVITWSAAGVPTGPVGSYTRQLVDAGLSPAVNGLPSASPLGLIGGFGPIAFDSLVGTPIANGSYRIGMMCAVGGAIDNGSRGPDGVPGNADDIVGGAQRYWESPITVSAVTPTTFNWSFGAVPGAPVATANGGDGVITGSITALTATPSVTGYTVTATRTGGTVDALSPRTTSVGAAAGAYSLAAVNGATYSVVITATNSVGVGAPTTVNVTPNFAPVSPAPVVNAPNGPSPINFQVTASTGVPPVGVTLVSHTVTFTPVGAAAPIAGSPFTVTGSPASIPLTGAPGASYTYTVVGNYSDGRTSVAAAGTVAFTSAQLIIQDIQVVRPAGALVLTQRCGVFGSAAAYTDTTFGTLPALAATADADTAGGTPTGTAPTLGVGGAADSLFAQYPYPVDGSGQGIATYPTNCAIDLGTGALITSGPRAGQYFKATGRIAQITVVNTRDADSGWTLNGRMSTFTSTTDGTDTFSGNLLGWDPEVTWDSAANLDGYDMLVNTGGVRQPQATASTTGLGASFNSTNTALASSLAQSPPENLAGTTGSLGQAVMDARLRLLIPVTADAGIYRGTLTFTTV